MISIVVVWLKTLKRALLNECLKKFVYDRIKTDIRCLSIRCFSIEIDLKVDIAWKQEENRVPIALCYKHRMSPKLMVPMHLYYIT